jgi:photosystem II stability/assembly factor-like uncharacterized protein
MLTGRRVAVALAATSGALVLAACDTGDFHIRFTVGEAGIILNTTDAGATWQAQASGVKKNLNGVSFGGPRQGCAVGDNGTIVFTTDGSTWNSASSVPTTLKLNAVDVEPFEGGSIAQVLGADVFGFAVGIKGTILATEGCGSWTAQTSGITANLNGVAMCRCTNVDAAWAVGDYGHILNTLDGGTTWNPQVSGTGQNLESVSFVDSNNGWAVGKRGVILNTLNGGTTWTPQTSGTTTELDGVVFADAQHGYAVGQKGVILATTNGGTTWIAQNSHTSQNLESVSTIWDANQTEVGLEVPNDYSDAIAVGKNGVIRMTTNEGATWTISNSGTTQNLGGAS